MTSSRQVRSSSDKPSALMQLADSYIVPDALRVKFEEYITKLGKDYKADYKKIVSCKTKENHDAPIS